MQIIEALKILAETRENQVLYLENIGTIPSTDELALQFDDNYQVFIGKLEEMKIDTEFKEKIRKKLNTINLLFDTMSNIPNNTFWDVSSLNNNEWITIRSIARETLTLILEVDIHNG